jgi:hypothetical protein
MTQAITPRDLDVDFSGVPRHWMNGNAVATAISNGVNMLFPIGERFFVRSVKHFAAAIIDPVLREQVRGFYGQEARHAREHDRFNEVLRTQGFQLDEFLAFYERTQRRVEAASPPKLRLATTAACEHFTAILAEGAFVGGTLDQIDPRMQTLLAWHAAEEIEHKAVAFDVLQQVDASYPLRVAGLALATTFLASYWFLAARMLLRQDGISLREAVRRMRQMREQDPIIQRVFVRGIREYLRRDFHPAQRDQSQIAARWFAAKGLAMPAAA